MERTLNTDGEPDWKFDHWAKAGESFLQETPGFRLEETVYHGTPDYGISERNQNLPDEQAISQYLIKKITDKVAQYRYMESRAAKRMENK